MGWYQVSAMAGTEKSPIARAHPGPVHCPLHAHVPVNLLQMLLSREDIGSIAFTREGGDWEGCQNGSLQNIYTGTDFPELLETNLLLKALAATLLVSGRN